MMEAAQDGDRNDFPFHFTQLFSFAWNRTFSAELLMRPGMFIPTHILADQESEMRLMENDYLIQEFPPETTQKPFDEWILPRRSASTLRIRVSNRIWSAVVGHAKMGTWKVKRPFVVVAPLRRKLDFWKPVSAVA
jgi:hypothetical protein